MNTKEYRKYWYKIAEAYGTPYELRTNEQKEITKEGLCNAFSYISSIEIEDIMMLFRGKVGYWYKYKYSFYTPIYGDTAKNYDRLLSKYDNLRALHALMFATMTFTEFKKLFDGLQITWNDYTWARD